MSDLPTMDDYLVARATQMAAADGAVFSTLYLIGAVTALQSEIFAARDRLLISPPSTMEVAGAPHGATADAAPDASSETLAEPEQEPAAAEIDTMSGANATSENPTEPAAQAEPTEQDPSA